MLRRPALMAAALVLCIAPAAAQRQGSPVEALLRQGLQALQVRDIPKAQDFLERAVERAPDEARAWMGLAQIYRLLNLHTQASRHAEEAARRGAESPRIQRALAMFHRDYANWAQAARWQERFAQSELADEEAPLEAVSYYLQANMPLQAVATGKAGLQRGESPALHNAVGKAYAMAGQASEGLRHLQQAVASQPYEEAYHYDVGYFHLRQLDFEAAREAFLAGRKYFDKSPAIELGLGIAAYGQRRFPDAVEHFLRAAALAPAMQQPHAFLGRLLQHAKDRLGEVEERMRTFHEHHSEDHFGPFLYAQVRLAKLGSRRDPEVLEAVEALLLESIERREDFWESHYELGAVAEKKRDFEAAEQHFRRAAELNPEVSKPHYRLARVYQRLGKLSEAKRERTLHRQITERERRAMQSSGLPADLVPLAGR